MSRSMAVKRPMCAPPRSRRIALYPEASKETMRMAPRMRTWSALAMAAAALAAGATDAVASVSTAPVPDMGNARRAGLAAPLQDGRVIVFGGDNAAKNVYYRTSEIYDPATNAWTAGPSALA